MGSHERIFEGIGAGICGSDVDSDRFRLRSWVILGVCDTKRKWVELEISLQTSGGAIRELGEKPVTGSPAPDSTL